MYVKAEFEVLNPLSVGATKSAVNLIDILKSAARERERSTVKMKLFKKRNS